MALNPKVVVLALAALSSVAAPPARAGAILPIWVSSCRAPVVEDGATLRCHGERIHLDGVEAPAPRRWARPGQPYGREAKALLKQLTRGEVRCGGHGRHFAGRHQKPDGSYAARYDGWEGKCSTDETPDLGAAMIRAGLATGDQFGQRDYASDEQEARAARRGRWSVAP